MTTKKEILSGKYFRTLSRMADECSKAWFKYDRQLIQTPKDSDKLDFAYSKVVPLMNQFRVFLSQAGLEEKSFEGIFEVKKRH